MTFLNLTLITIMVTMGTNVLSIYIIITIEPQQNKILSQVHLKYIANITLKSFDNSIRVRPHMFCHA